MNNLLKLIKSVFNNNISTDFPDLNKSQLMTIIKENRKILSKMPSWMNDSIKAGSYYNYGIPDEISTLIDLDIGDEITYTDLIVYLSQRLKSINYLELGVSVGKNFFQICNQLNNSNLTGFDIENINPLLEKHFELLHESKWYTKPDSIRKQESYIRSYKFGSNRINYLAGDIWDQNSWKILKGMKYNVIFSDALHDPKALLWEYEMIKEYQLLDDQFLIVWDDLNNGLEKSFYSICKSLKKTLKSQNLDIRLIKINGWLGKNYSIKHDVGLITNIKV